MKFLAIYRASFYLMLNLATLVLSIDATDDNPLAMLYPPTVGIASLIAFFTVDRRPELAPSRTTANILALLSAGLGLAEYHYDNTLMLLAAGHWLVYLQLIKMFLPKTVEDDWFLFLLGLVQVLVGGVMSQSDKVGVALLGWALMSLWVLTLFALRRESIRLGSVPLAGSDPLADRDEPFRGLIDAAFLVSSARVAALTLGLGGMIFLAMPRYTASGNSRGGVGVGKHLSGFDDQVTLGQLGEILENDSVVMSVELSDHEGRRVGPEADDEYRWRGISLDEYRQGRWSRPKLVPDGYVAGHPRPFGRGDVHQSVKLEPTDSPILFSMRPILQAEAYNRPAPELNRADGTMFRLNASPGSLDYAAWTSNRPDMAQEGESIPRAGYLDRVLRIEDRLRDRLRPIALAQVVGIDPSDRRAQAEALVAYLKTSGEFSYTLEMASVDPKTDPVADFLIRRKQGHCEYFASALTLMLRSIDLPARMVNGFKGGDYNAVTGAITVRQKHAHSWVEVLIGESGHGPDGLPIWLTLDPTPADQRDRSVAEVGGIAGRFRIVTDLVRYIWIFYVIGFNSDRQERFLYGPIRALIAEAGRGFSIIGRAIADLLTFPSVESFFSLRGFLVSFAGLTILAGLARLASRFGPRLVRRLRGQKAANTQAAAAIAFYRRLLTLLGGIGLERPPAETPREFARRAAIHLAGHGAGSESVADVPPLVVDAFYKIRFGDQTLIEDDFEAVNGRLDALERQLRPATT